MQINIHFTMSDVQQSGLLLAYIQVQLIQNVAIHLSLPSSHFQLIWRAWY